MLFKDKIIIGIFWAGSVIFEVLAAVFEGIVVVEFKERGGVGVRVSNGGRDGGDDGVGGLGYDLFCWSYMDKLKVLFIWDKFIEGFEIFSLLGKSWQFVIGITVATIKIKQISYNIMKKYFEFCWEL